MPIYKDNLTSRVLLKIALSSMCILGGHRKFAKARGNDRRMRGYFFYWLSSV